MYGDFQHKKRAASTPTDTLRDSIESINMIHHPTIDAGVVIIVIAVLCLVTVSHAASGIKADRVDSAECNEIPRDCTEIRDCSNWDESGIYAIQPVTRPEPFYVYCDMDTDGGGWTVFQKRKDDTIDFYRNWAEYKEGFGHINTNYWLGNDKLFYLTAQGNYQLRIDMTDFEGASRYAVYDGFQIGDENQRYKLHFGQYRGNAGDSLNERHRDMYFSTKDCDYDQWDGNCAVTYKGAWWYDACHQSNLNGLYLHGPHDSPADGINWYHWHGYYYSLKTTQMKVRRQS